MLDRVFPILYRVRDIESNRTVLEPRAFRDKDIQVTSIDLLIDLSETAGATWFGRVVNL